MSLIYPIATFKTGTRIVSHSLRVIPSRRQFYKKEPSWLYHLIYARNKGRTKMYKIYIKVTVNKSK